MTVYLITFLLSAVFALFSDRFAVSLDTSQYQGFRKRGSLSILCFVISGAILAVVRGIRFNVGYDYAFSYLPSFQQVLNGGKSHYEPIFNALLKLATLVSADYRVYFFIDSLLFISIVWIALALSSKHVFLPIVLFVGGYDYFRSMCYMAQYLAMAICLVAVAVFLKRKFTLGVVLVLIAGGIHLSGLVFLLVPAVYLFVKYLDSFFKLVSFVAALLLFIIPARYLLPIVYRSTRFSFYNGTMYDNGDVQIALVLINIGILLLLLFVGFFCFNENPLLISFATSIQSLAVMLCLLQGVVPLVFRLVWYFMFPYIICVPLVLRLLATSKAAISRSTAVVTGFVFFATVIYITFMIYIPGNLDAILPYKTIFDGLYL